MADEGAGMQWTLALIKPDAVKAGKAEEIMQRIEDSGFIIKCKEQIQLTEERASAFYAEHDGKPFFPTLKEFMTSGPIWALVLAKDDAIKSWRSMMGPTNTEAAKDLAPSSMRALYGTDGTQNATHGSDSPESAKREVAFFFPDLEGKSPDIDSGTLEWTLAMIKPDAVMAGKAAEIMAKIAEAGFTIEAKKQLKLTDARAARFYAEHDGKPFFPKLKEFMTSGPIWALVLSKSCAIKAWRDMMGPTNTLLAQEKAPASLRALYGTDGTKNATHGSDSIESARREIAFHFPELGAQAGPYKDLPALPPADAIPPPPAPEAPVEVQEPEEGVQWTLALIKPDAVKAGVAPEIIQLIELNGFTIIAREYLQLTPARAAEFYAEHAEKEFFPNLQKFMSSGPIWALVLSRPNAITRWRSLMGPTNTFKARQTAPRTLRAIYGTDGTQNATHGSDAVETARREIKFFFPSLRQEPYLDDDHAKDYFSKELEPVLIQALTALAKEKPTAEKFEAITFLANWLLAHNPNKPRIKLPDELELKEDDEDDEEMFKGKPVQYVNCKPQPPPSAPTASGGGAAKLSAGDAALADIQALQEADPEALEAAATTVQAHFRGFKARQALDAKKADAPEGVAGPGETEAEAEEHEAAVKVQSAFRGHQARKQVEQMKADRR